MRIVGGGRQVERGDGVVDARERVEAVELEPASGSDHDESVDEGREEGGARHEPRVSTPLVA